MKKKRGESAHPFSHDFLGLLSIKVSWLVSNPNGKHVLYYLLEWNEVDKINFHSLYVITKSEYSTFLPLNATRVLASVINNRIVVNVSSLLSTQQYDFRLSSHNAIGQSEKSTVRYTVDILRCPKGKKVSSNNFVCEPCSPGTYNEIDDHSRLECKACPQRYFANDPGAIYCEPCPRSGVICDGGRLYLLEHYWRPNSWQDIKVDTQFYPCFNREACIVNHTTFSVTCDSELGYDPKSPFCATCLEDKGFVSKGNTNKECAKCLSSKTNWIILCIAVVVSIFCIFLLLRVSTGAQSHATIILRIFLNYIMVLGMIGKFKSRGPELFRRLFSWQV